MVTARVLSPNLVIRAIRQPLRPAIRSYHSQYHPETAPFPPAQDKILSSALCHVSRHGFTDTALTLGAKDAGYLEVSVQLFPRGVHDLITYYLVTQRLALKDRVQFSSQAKVGLNDKVKTLAWERLLANKDVIHQWQGALGYMSLPSNVPASLTELNLLADEIWYLAGDTAVDFSWYTKRASLAMVYASSEVFMTRDASKDFAATKEFLENRLRDAETLGTIKGGLASYVGFWAGNSVNLARAWGLKI